MTTVDDFKLPLPSTYPPEVWKHALFKALVKAECTLREAQANDVLKQLRTKLTCQSLFKIDMSHHSGQENLGTRRS